MSKKKQRKNLNADLMIDVEDIKKQKKKRRTNFAGFKAKKLASNKTEDKIPTDLKTVSFKLLKI